MTEARRPCEASPGAGLPREGCPRVSAGDNPRFAVMIADAKRFDAGWQLTP